MYDIIFDHKTIKEQNRLINEETHQYPPYNYIFRAKMIPKYIMFSKSDHEFIAGINYKYDPRTIDVWIESKNIEIHQNGGGAFVRMYIDDYTLIRREFLPKFFSLFPDPTTCCYIDCVPKSLEIIKIPNPKMDNEN